MIFYFILIFLYLINLIQAFRKEGLGITNLIILYYFIKVVIPIPFISSGYLFFSNFSTGWNPGLYRIFIICSFLLLLSAYLSVFSFKAYYISFLEKVNYQKYFVLLILIFLLYTTGYYLSMRVTPPLLSPLFGEDMLTNRLKLSYAKENESLFFYGNTIVKDYLLPLIGIGILYLSRMQKRNIVLKFLTFWIIFYIVYMGRKSSVAFFFLNYGIALYLFKLIDKRSLVNYTILTIFSLVLFFFLYNGIDDIFLSLGTRLFSETAFSYYQYDFYINDPNVGFNIFNFPGSESIFGIEHFDIKKSVYEELYSSRVESSGDRNAQGFSGLFLVLGLGREIGFAAFFVVSYLTLTITRLIDRSIYRNKKSVFFFILVYFFISLSNNYFAVNIFEIFDVTVINFKFLIFIVIIAFFVNYRIIKRKNL